MVDKTSRAVVFKPDKTSSYKYVVFKVFSYANIHKSIIVMNSLDTRFSRNVFWSRSKKLAAHVLSGLEPLGCALWF